MVTKVKITVVMNFTTQPLEITCPGIGPAGFLDFSGAYSAILRGRQAFLDFTGAYSAILRGDRPF
jgi:hypothetical protein